MTALEYHNFTQPKSRVSFAGDRGIGTTRISVWHILRVSSAMEARMSVHAGNVTRRTVLAGAAATAVVSPAFAQDCRIGSPPHTKGPLVFMNYDQVELDAAY